MKSLIILILGVIVTAAGLLFALQGASVVRWPASSSMLGDRDWIEYGIVITLMGIALLLTARRIRQS
jgi:hypothetical protein